MKPTLSPARDYLWLLLALLPLFLPGLTHGNENIRGTTTARGVSAAAGSGGLGQDHDAYRVAVQKHWQRRWWQNDHFHFTGYWDLSVAQFDATNLHGGPADDGADRIWALALTPVIRWQFNAIGNTQIAPFLELAIGVAYLSETELRSGKIRSYPLGSHFQFEDRGVIGVRLGAAQRWELAYQRMHYSNLDLASENNGVDTHMAMLSYRF